MAKIFLNYRRSDTAGHAGRIAIALREHFGEDQVFQDIETIAPGSDFQSVIEKAVGGCQVLIVLIGNTWLTESDDQGGRRLTQPADFVRLEIATALRRKVKILPVLVEGARMPSEEDLPDDIKRLSKRQSLELSDTRWDYDCERLLKAVDALTPKPNRYQGALMALLLILLSAGVAIGIANYLHRPADISGRWQLANGSFWQVTQQGEELFIDEVHYQSKQVWKRGRGRIEGRHLNFKLELVFDRHGPNYIGEAELSEDGKLLKGEVVADNSGMREALFLNR